MISRHTYYFVAIIGIAMVTGAIAWHLAGWLEEPAAEKDSLPVVAAPQLDDLKKRAEGNDATAEYELAQRYATGIGVPASPKEEYSWLQRSAQHGNVEAQYQLGSALREGRGTVQDFEEARKWLQRAAEGGSAKAQYALGLMYRTGMGAPVDSVKAYVWLNVAAAQGVSGAASARDLALERLSAAELREAQAEARRFSETYIPKATPAR